MKDIANHYTLLTADERFRLFVEAMGRKDEQELDRLEATCPRKRYDAQDYEYRRRKEYFTLMALATALDHVRIDVLALLALVVNLANEGADHDACLERASDAFQKLMHVRHGKRAGWERFCEQIGVSPGAITEPFVRDVEWAMEIAESVLEIVNEDCPDEASADDIAAKEFDLLVEAWGGGADHH